MTWNTAKLQIKHRYAEITFAFVHPQSRGFEIRAGSDQGWLRLWPKSPPWFPHSHLTDDGCSLRSRDGGWPAPSRRPLRAPLGSVSEQPVSPAPLGALPAFHQSALGFPFPGSLLPVRVLGAHSAGHRLCPLHTAAQEFSPAQPDPWGLWVLKDWSAPARTPRPVCPTGRHCGCSLLCSLGNNTLRGSV